MVIGKLSGVASLVVILILAGLFLRQAAGTSIGVAGQDVGAGLTGISGGIDSLVGSIFNPIVAAIGGFSSFIANPFGSNKEEEGRAQNTYGYVRDEPTPNTSRIQSGTATTSTIARVTSRPSSGVSFASSGHSGSWSGGGFRAAN
jgi:hypothetical protein